MGTETTRGKLDHILTRIYFKKSETLFIEFDTCVCIYITVDDGGGEMRFLFLPHCEILHVKCHFAFSGYVWVSFFVNQFGGRGSLRTANLIVVCIFAAKHAAQPRHQPNFFFCYHGKQCCIFSNHHNACFFTELHTLQIYFTVTSEEILKEKSFLKLLNVVSCDRFFSLPDF